MYYARTRKYTHCAHHHTPFYGFTGMRDFGRGGVIVNIGSSSTSGGRPGQSAYASSKAGIQTLTEVLALEGKDYGENGYKEIKVTAMITTL